MFPPPPLPSVSNPEYTYITCSAQSYTHVYTHSHLLNVRKNGKDTKANYIIVKVFKYFFSHWQPTSHQKSCGYFYVLSCVFFCKVYCPLSVWIVHSGHFFSLNLGGKSILKMNNLRTISLLNFLVVECACGRVCEALMLVLTPHMQIRLGLWSSSCPDREI